MYCVALELTETRTFSIMVIVFCFKNVFLEAHQSSSRNAIECFMYSTRVVVIIKHRYMYVFTQTHTHA